MHDGIYDILSSKLHNQHYLNKYISFIKKCQYKNIGYDGRTEKHHICPESIFPDYICFKANPWNKADLTPRQHYIAHMILAKVYNSPKMKQALWFMSNGNWKSFVSPYSKIYANLREELMPLWKESGVRLGLSSTGNAVVKNEEGDIFKISVNDPRIYSGELVGIVKGTVTVKDAEGNNLRVSLDDPRYLSRELKGVVYGKVAVKDIHGNNLSVPLDDHRLATGELVSVSRDMMPAKDNSGNIFWISNKDKRLITGELFALNTGNTVVKDKEGNRFSVSVDDPRLKTGELVGIVKGTVTVKDAEGNNLRVSLDDPRYLSGELVGTTKGQTSKSKDRICYTDGKRNIYLHENENLPTGYRKGSFSSSKKVYNNGKIEIKVVEGEEPAGFFRGTLFKKIWVTDGRISKYAPEDNIPDGFVKGRASRTKLQAE